MPQNLAIAISVLERHPPVAVTGRLAEALGGNTATFRQLFDAAMQQQDAALRNEAFRASLAAFEAEALRGFAGSRAEEIANQVATQAQAGELRSRALSV